MDIILNFIQTPEINISFNSIQNEIALNLIQPTQLNLNFTNIHIGAKGDAGEGIENFEADLSLLYQIAKL